MKRLTSRLALANLKAWIEVEGRVMCHYGDGWRQIPRQERTGGRFVMSVEQRLGGILVTYDIFWCLTLYLFKGPHTRGRTVGANLCR